MSSFKADMDNFDKIVRQRVNKALQTNQIDLQKKVVEQEEEIKKLTNHNNCFQETIVYLEEQLKQTKNDLIDKTRESIAFTNGFKGMHNRNFESYPMVDDTFDRDDDEIEAGILEDHKRIMARMQRDKANVADVTDLDNSPCDDVLYDDNALDQKFGTYARRNRKQFMDELANIDTEQSYREQTEDDAMNTDRGMMRSKKKPPSNPMTKSLHLPRNESDQKSETGVLSLGGIKLDFRKSSSGGGLMKMLTGGGSGSASNKISDDVRRSRDAGLGAARGSNGSGQIAARYSTIEMSKQGSQTKVKPYEKY